MSKQTNKEKKIERAELKDGVIKLFHEVKHHMKPRTRDDYGRAITDADKLQTIKRLGRELETFKEVSESNQGLLLTKQKQIK